MSRCATCPGYEEHGCSFPSCDALPREHARLAHSTGQTHLVVDNHTGRVESMHGSRAAALVAIAVLDYRGRYAAVRNPYGGSE